MPTQLLRKPCERYYSLEEVRRLLSKAHGREHLVLRIFINCGLRPGELFALREDDVEPGQIRIDEAVKEVEVRGSPHRRNENHLVQCLRRDQPGTSGGTRYLDPGASAATFVSFHGLGSSSDLLFPSEAGTTFRLGNYLKRYLKPLAKRAGILDLTYQALRRTCATHFQKHGKPRDIQAQLRHSKLEMTGRYIKEIPAQVRAAVDRMDHELCQGTEQEGTVQ